MVQLSEDQANNRARRTESAPELSARAPSSSRKPIIEGNFTYDSLEDLFMYLCSRGETLLWQLSTLAGSFALIFDQGQPADIMFRPVRRIGAYVGLKALQTLFQQEGGEFSVYRSPPAITRRSLNASGKQLLINMATLNDERSAPAVLSGNTFDTSAELALVDDLPPEEHRTAFLTRSSDVPLVEVLQLFSVSRHAYRVVLTYPDAKVAGHIDLSANDVTGAATPTERSLSALLTLLHLQADLIIKVSPVRPPSPATSLGKLDALLLRAMLSGSLEDGEHADEGQTVPGGDTTGNRPLLAQLTPPSPLRRLAKLMRRK